METFLWKLDGTPPSLERLSSHPRPIFPHAACWRTLADLALAPCGDASGTRRVRASIRCRTLLFIGLDRAIPKETRTEASGWRNITLSCDVRSGTWWSCCWRRCLSCCSGRARASSATSGSWRVSPVLRVMVGARETIGSASTGHRVTHLHEPLLSGQARRAASHVAVSGEASAGAVR